MPGASGDAPIKKDGHNLKAETALSKWQRLGCKWRSMLPIESGQPELGSWLEQAGQTFGCKCCKFAGLQGAFGTYTVTTADALQLVNFQKHASSTKHQAAAASWMVNTVDAGLGAPSHAEYQNLISRLEGGQATCGSMKEAQMTWTLSEAIKSADQIAISKADSIALFRDESKGRLLLRFRSVTRDLVVRSGTVGQARDFGTGSLNIVKATSATMKRFCSRFHGAPGKVKKPAFLKKNLYRGFRRAVKIITTDSAADEMLAGEMMRSKVLTCMSTKLTPRLRFVLRDATHGTRRLVSRGWAADAFISDVIV